MQWPNTYIACTRNIPVAVLRILFQHSVLIRAISHICHKRLATDDHARIIRKQGNPAILAHLYVTGYNTCDYSLWVKIRDSLMCPVAIPLQEERQKVCLYVMFIFSVWFIAFSGKGRELCAVDIL
jgi:hypothetical protein